MSRFLIEVMQLVTHDEFGPLKRRDQYWERIGQIDQYLRINLVIRFNDVSTWRLRCPAGTDQSKLLKPGRKILIWYQGMDNPLLSGPLTQIERYWDDSNKGLGSVDFIGSCDNHVLADNLWTPTPDFPEGNDTYQGRYRLAYDQQTSYAFSRALVAVPSYQFGPLSEIAKYGETYTDSEGSTRRRAGDTEGYRTLPGYKLLTNTEPGSPGGGPTRDEYPRINFKARYDSLINVFREKAATAVDEAGRVVPCGFRMVWDADSKQITPRLFFPNPEESAKKNTFSPALGNLRRYQYSLRSPGANRAFFAFDGQGKDRNIHYFPVDNYDEETGEGASWPLGEWGIWKEEFLDRRDQAVPGSLTDPNEQAEAEAQIQQAKREFYEASKPQAAISMEVLDTEEFQFGRDYFVGDYVQVDIDGELITDILREVNLVEESGRYTITPTVGTGDASETPALYRQVRRIWNRLDMIGKRHG
ncbi:hypothetical protein AB0I72_26715 [Nocardiopsis sp. NPDC049922]|uniref:Gp37-like protein n=1 Tax=Nocardiopsis sp. NPDC049922 TaxID=3155157 RepID=UPI00340DF4CC